MDWKGLWAWMRGCAALAVVALGVFALPAAADRQPVPVFLEFDGSGTFEATNGALTDGPARAEDSLQWKVLYKGTLNPDGSLTFQSALGSGEGGQTTAPPPGAYHFTDVGIFKTDCSGSIPLAPSAAPPVATFSGGKLTVQSVTGVDQADATHQFDGCVGTGTDGLAQNNGQEASSVVGAFDPYLPGVLSAQVSFSAADLKNGTFTKNVSSADAPAQLPSSCASEFGWSDPGQCNMSLSWTGTITVLVPCAQVTSSEGAAPAVGTVISQGQRVSTGAGGRAVLTLVDGSEVRIGPNSSTTCDASDAGGDPPITLRTILGIIWSKIDNPANHVGCTSAAGGYVDGIQCVHDVGGPRGAADGTAAAAATSTSFTVDSPRGIVHVISGTVTVTAPHARPLRVSAGMSAHFTAHGATLTSAWPAADQSVVPAAALPPAITAVKVKADRGRRPSASFRLSKAAKLTVQVLRGTRRVISLTTTGRPGPIRLTFHKPLPAGSYTVTVAAVSNGLTEIITARLRVR
jgi:hypothetical protein